MNKYQEAVLVLMCDDDYLGCVDKENARRVIQELVDRATPKKPISLQNLVNEVCPNCSLIFATDENGRFDKHKHCPNCGQALDWSTNK